MEYIKRKISKGDITSKSAFTYGHVVKDRVHLNVPLYQTTRNIGLFTDMHYVDEDVDYSPLIQKLQNSGYTFDFYTASTPTVTISGFDEHIRVSGRTVDEYFKRGDHLTGSTESRLKEVQSYDQNNPYIVGFDLDEEPYVDLSGNTGTSVNRVLYKTPDVTGYTIGAFSGSPHIGTTSQTRGIQYETDDNEFTTFGFTPEGWNDTNVTLSALTKQEYLMGITEHPKVNSDLFIDRGVVSPLESHFRLSEVKTLEEMETYNNGFYNLIKI